MPKYSFGPYTLDSDEAQLLRGSDAVPLTPKAFAVLHVLLERGGHLVTKEQLFNAVWANVFVGDAALKVCVREIRKALDDDPQTPRYIETVHRRGYRFVATLRPDAPPPRAVTRPETHYARSGDVNIAYQVVGNGPIDLVFVMGWISHLEYFWEEPSFARFLRRLASFSRLILFDKRGTGLSDRVAELPTLEQRMDDVRAVMDAVGSRQAALLGISEGGPMCSLFAATHSNRTLALVMYGTYAKRVWDPQYPWAPTPEQREEFYREIRETWGGPVGVEERAPSVAGDPRFRDWWATFLRMGASPGAALALTRMNTEIDIRSVLPTVRVPTLILHRTADRCLKVEEGRLVAELIPNARFVELPGQDHLPFVGDQDALVDQIEEFLIGATRQQAPDRVLATVLSGQIGAGTAGTIAPLRATMQREIDWYRGQGFEVGPNGFVASFDGPARAIRCACALVRALRGSGVDLSIGLHTGECELKDDRVAGTAVAIARQVACRAAGSEVLVSRTVKDLVAGSGLTFQERDELALDETGEAWRLYAVEQ